MWRLIKADLRYHILIILLSMSIVMIPMTLYLIFRDGNLHLPVYLWSFFAIYAISPMFIITPSFLKSEYSEHRTRLLSILPLRPRQVGHYRLIFHTIIQAILSLYWFVIYDKFTIERNGIPFGLFASISLMSLYFTYWQMCFSDIKDFPAGKNLRWRIGLACFSIPLIVMAIDSDYNWMLSSIWGALVLLVMCVVMYLIVFSLFIRRNSYQT